MFVDGVSFLVSAGRGGDGVVAWRREKFIPKGGPAGGDGGNGGSIYIKADENVYSLEDYRNKKFIRAECGKPGGQNNRKGKNGTDLTINVPPGTLIKNAKTKEILFDLTEKGQKITICKGGIGGKGNSRFKSPTNQAPIQFTKGTYGESLEIELELKLIADIGLVGYPNAGKSTLMNAITHIDVKIAPYPFTTLIPNLGIIEFEDYSRLLIADIPGIIEGAHLNKGLGFSFLKHIERSAALVYIIDMSGIDGRDPIKDFEVLQNELQSFNKDLTNKPFLIALNKIDTEESLDNLNRFKKHYKPFYKSKDQVFEISAFTGQGLPEFIEAMQKIGQKNGKKFN